MLLCKMFGFFKFLFCIPFLTQICGFSDTFHCCISTSPLRYSQAAHVYPLSVFFEMPLGKEFQILCGSFTAGNGFAVVVLVRRQMW